MKLIPTATALLTVLLFAAPLAAERLVLRDGTAVEIRGGYERRGALVVFTLASGTLGSLRADEIDFAATEAANRADPETAAGASAEDAPAAAEPVLVLTNADLPEVQAPAPALPSVSLSASAADGSAGEDEAGSDDEVATAPGPDGDAQPPAASVFVPLDGALAVTGWSVEDSGTVDGLELVGSLVNSSAVLAVDVAVTVSIGGDGGPARTFEAFVANPTLGPGRRTSFRVPLRDEFTAPESPEFTVTGRGLRPRIVPEPPEAETAGDQTPDVQTPDGQTSDDQPAGGLSADTSENPRDRRP